ncbi:MAG: hypothetical protein K2I72_02205, partial [Bacilli bacterium]|nr:hypothetical protein [Bacilli bacterium]
IFNLYSFRDLDFKQYYKDGGNFYCRLAYGVSRVKDDDILESDELRKRTYVWRQNYQNHVKEGQIKEDGYVENYEKFYEEVVSKLNEVAKNIGNGKLFVIWDSSIRCSEQEDSPYQVVEKIIDLLKDNSQVCLLFTVDNERDKYEVEEIISAYNNETDCLLFPSTWYCPNDMNTNVQSLMESLLDLETQFSKMSEIPDYIKNVMPRAEDATWMAHQLKTLLGKNISINQSEPDQEVLHGKYLPDKIKMSSSPRFEGIDFHIKYNKEEFLRIATGEISMHYSTQEKIEALEDLCEAISNLGMQIGKPLAYYEVSYGDARVPYYEWAFHYKKEWIRQLKNNILFSGVDIEELRIIDEEPKQKKIGTKND